MASKDEEAAIMSYAKMPDFGGFVPPFPWPVVRSSLVITLGGFIMAIGGFMTSYTDVVPDADTSPLVQIPDVPEGEIPYPVFNKPAAISIVTHILFNLAIIIAIMVSMCVTMHSIAMWGMFSNAAKKGDMSMSMTLDEMIEKIPVAPIRVQAQALAAKMKELFAKTPTYEELKGKSGIKPETLKSFEDKAKATGEKIQDGAAARMDRYKSCAREMYVMTLHTMSICNIQLCIILLIVSATFAGVFSLTPLLYVGALVMVGGAMACRWYASIDISYLYTKIFDVDEQLKGIPWGAVRCLLFTAFGMLLLDGGLFKAADSFKLNGFGLPAAMEAPLMNIWDWSMFWTELATFPICFAGVSANIVSIRRGAYLQPECEGKKCCGTKIHYKADATNALKSGTWDKFQKAKKFRTQLAIFIFGGVLAGVFTLIPVYWVIYAVVDGYIGLCDAENPSLPANFEFLGNLIGAEPSYFAAISSVDQAKFTTTMCGSAEEKTGFANMSYWLFVMLTGLFMHLPGIGGGWANLNKYTGLMTVIDNSLTNGVPAGKKTMM